MVNFDLKKSAIYRALLFDKVIFFRRANFFAGFCIVFSLAFLFLFVGGGYLGLRGPFFPLAIFFFSLFLFFLQADLFFGHFLKKPALLMKISEVEKDIDKINIADFLSFESAKIFQKAEERGGVDSYLLLFFLLKEAREMNFVFYRTLIDKEQAILSLETFFREREFVRDKTYTDCFLKTVKDAFLIAVQRGNERITNEDVFTALSRHNRYLQEVLYRAGLKKRDIFDLTSWQIRINEKENPWLYKNLIKRGRLGTEWASGHTPFLENFSIDWTKAMKLAGFPKTVGHQEEIDSLERVLSRSEINSAVLTGRPGSGRRSIIQEVVKKSFLGEGLSEINHCRFLEVDMSSLLAYAKGVEETEKVLEEVFSEATKAGNVVLIINDFHNFIGKEQRPGVIDISGILSSYLHLRTFRVIGISSYAGFRENIENNTQVFPLIEKIEVKEATQEDTLILLQRKTLLLEKKYKKLISFAALKKVIYLSERYIQNAPFPEKALDLLEESVVHVYQQREDILLPKHVEKIVSERTEVPVGEVGKEEREVLLNMEKLLHERVVNQEEAVKAISFALRRSRADVDTRKGLIGSFLFLGPTGVGKTETAKAIADVYFGTEKRINRIDMSEFQNISDISRLIGSYNEEGSLVTGVREDPFSLVLLDEIEKAHPDILNLFLQVLDEGHLTDGKGRKVNFQNCMLIATSNAGSQIVLDAVEKKEDWKQTKEKILKNLFREGVFRPEFINRFDETVLFTPLSREDLFKVAEIQLQKIVKSLKEKDISLNVTDELKKKVVEMSYDPVFGAREMQRNIQNSIGEALSSAILKEELEKGDSIKINPEDFSVIKE